MRIIKSIKRMRRDSAGFSMVELIIVVAILAIVMGLFITGMDMLFNLPSRQCARELKAWIEKTRVDTMGRTTGAVSLKVSLKEDGVYVQESGDINTNDQEERISSERLTLSLFKKDDTNPHTFPDDGLILRFRRETGGFNFGSGPEYTGILVESGRDKWRLNLNKYSGTVELVRE